MIQPETISIVLAYGILVASTVLFSAFWFKLMIVADLQRALKRLSFFGAVIGVLAIGLWIMRWIIPYVEGDEYTRYAFSERVLGPYGYGVWLPLLFSVLSTIAILWIKTRRLLLSWIAIAVVGFGPILYEIWMNFIVNRHREFLTSNYRIELPEWYQIVFTALFAGAGCLLVVLYPQVKKLVVK